MTRARNRPKINKAARIALAALLGTFVLLTLAAVWLTTTDLGAFKPQVERFVTEQTGREFSIDGSFSVDIARHSTIVAESLRFQNADWAADPDMITTGRVEVRIDTWSLISGPIVIDFLDIDDAVVRLVHKTDGDPNWALPVQKDDSDEESAGLDFLLKRIEIDHVDLLLESPDRDRPLNLNLEYLRQQHRNDTYLDLSLSATLGGRQISLDGEVGTWEALLSGRDFDFDIDAVLDTFEFTGSGRIDDLADLRRPRIEFSATGPDVDDLTRMLGLGDEGEGNIDLRGTLVPQEDGPLVLEIDGNIGQSEIEANGTVADLRSFDSIGLKLLASGPDLGLILRFAGIHDVRQAPFMLSIDAESQGQALVLNEANMVFAEAQMTASANIPNFPSTDDAEASLTIEGPRLERFRDITGIPGTATGEFALGASMHTGDDGIEIVRMNARTALGEVHANGQLGDPDTLLGTKLNFEIQGDSLERLTEAYGIVGLPDYPFELRGAAEYVQGHIRTQGPVVALVEQVTASVDGQIALTRGIEGSDFAFEIEGPDLAAIVEVFTTASGIPAQPYDLDGHISILGDGYRLREIQGRVGSSKVSLDGVLSTKPGLDGTRFDFELEGPEFQELIHQVDKLKVRPGAFQLSGSILLGPDMLTLEDIELDRPAGKATLDLRLGLPAERKWMEFDVHADGPDVRSIMVELDRFEVYEQPFSLNVRGDRSGAHWNFDRLDVGIGDATITATGDLEFEDATTSTEFNFMLNAPSLARLGEFDGRSFNDQGLSIVAHGVGGDGVLSFDQLDAKIGDSDINGKVLLRKGDIPGLEIDISSDSVSYAPILKPGEVEYEPEPEFEDGKLIPDTEVPFDAMKKINLSLEIDIRELTRDTLYMRDVEFDAVLQDGALEISNAGFKARSGALVARGRLEPAGGSGSASIELVARQFAPGMSELNADLAMIGDLDINLRSTGTDVRALFGNTDGVVFLNTRGGRITDNRFIRALYGDLLQELITTINPFRTTDPYTELECIVVPLRFDGGQVTSVPNSFISTTKIRLVSTVSINLKTEDLGIAFRTTPRRALSVSAGELVNPFVQVIGTLGEPRLAVDERGVLLSGGAAVATGGLTLVARGLWGRLSQSGDPCKQVADGAIDKLGDRFPQLTLEGLDRTSL